MVNKNDRKVSRSDSSVNFHIYFSLVLVLIIVVLGGILYMVSNNREEVVVEGNPVVIFETNMGNFEVEVFLNESPITAGNFMKLVEEEFYNNIKFHRVIEGFMIQGGDPYSKDDTQVYRWGTGGTGTPIEDEFIEGLSNVRGTLAMANSGPNSGDSQFFINVADNTFLDWDKEPLTSKHPVFGKVISGMDVVDKISNVSTTGSPFDRPEDSVFILKIHVK